MTMYGCNVAIPTDKAIGAVGDLPTDVSGLLLWYDYATKARCDIGAALTGSDAADEGYFTATSVGNMQPGSNDFCILMWVQVKSTNHDLVLISKGNGGAGAGYNLKVNTSRQLVWSVEGIAVTHSTALTLDTWYMVYASYNYIVGTVGLAINDGASQTNASTPASVSSSDALKIGDGGGAGAHVTWMDSCAFFYQRLLSQSERTTFYNSGAPDDYTSLTVSQKSGLVAFFEFQETSGNRSDSHTSGITLSEQGTVDPSVGLTQFTCGAGDTVARWGNRQDSGTDQEFRMLNDFSKRPLWRTDGIDFDGTDDYLSRQNGLSQWDSILDDSAGTVFVVASLGTHTAQDAMFAAADFNGSNPIWRVCASNTGQSQIQFRNAAATTNDRIRGSTSLTEDEATFFLLAITSSGTAYTIHLNGSSETLVADAGSNDGDWLADESAFDVVSVGALLANNSPASHWNGRIAEIVYYDNALSSDDRVLVEGYLNTKYSIY